MWSPEDTDLGSINENVNFSHTITYSDPETMEEYDVVIVANEINPITISISENAISGYYTDSFENTITYRTFDGQFPVVSKFGQIDVTKLFQMISYKASTSLSRTFSYTATAKDGDTVIATQVYTKTVTNDWTSGKDSLQSFVRITL